MDDLPISARPPAASRRIALHTAVPLLCAFCLNVARERGDNVGFDHCSRLRGVIQRRADHECA
jgi:hypothetical protein